MYLDVSYKMALAILGVDFPKVQADAKVGDD